ncbi:hypothetical protein ADIS_0720 [Lunatimonas lonarensis]|uniref:Uncharacterized protein n=1 Tax=Lunatimonas lonarensis TaxID=1232681 RepID=R7ZXT1_9BACT|nr:hypothetical protein ADIS_0720 [Lunatimonas lonarensis]
MTYSFLILKLPYESIPTYPNQMTDPTDFGAWPVQCVTAKH